MNSTEHLLVCLMEECAEVQHRCAKALRFGLANKDPNDIPNHVLIMEELIDLKAIVKMLVEHHDLHKDDEEVDKIFDKQTKVRKYMSLARRLETLA